MNAQYAFAALIAGLALTGNGIAQDKNPKANDRSQARLEKEVRHEIVTQPFFGVFDDVSFRVDGYNVTLLGQVTRPTLKSSIEKAVKGIEGVETVNNQIEVLPLNNNDDRLRIALYQAIYGFSALQRYAMPVIRPIRIIVKNGHATLEGVVDREADKNMVGIRANGVSGVFSVTNNLRVEKSS